MVKKSNVQTSPCANAQGHFCPLSSLIFPVQFSFYFGDNFSVGPKRKYLGPTIYFPSSPPNQTRSKKKNFFLFSLKKKLSTLFHLCEKNTILCRQKSFGGDIYISICVLFQPMSLEKYGRH